MRRAMHDLHRSADRVGDDRHLVRRDADKAAPMSSAPSAGDCATPLIVSVGAEHDIQRQPPWTGVLAADDLGDVGQFHGRVQLRARAGVTVRTPRLNATSGALTSATACSGVVASKTTMSAGLPTAMP